MLKKIKRLLGAKTNTLLDNLDNPIEQIDYSIKKMKDKENELIVSLVKVKSNKKQLNSLIEEKQQSIEELNSKAKKMKKDGFSKQEVKLVIERVQIEEQAKQKFETQLQKQDKIIQQLSEKRTEIENLITQWQNKKRTIEAQQDLNDVNQSLYGISDKDSKNNLNEELKNLKEAEKKVEQGEFYSEALKEVNNEISDDEKSNKQSDEEIEEIYEDL